MNYTIKKIALTEFSIGKWIYSNWLSDTRPEVNIPFNVFWQCGPIYYKSSSLFDKFQIWFYSIIIPIIIYKIFEPVLLTTFTFWKPIIISHIKMIVMITNYGLMAIILFATIMFFLKSLKHSK